MKRGNEWLRRDDGKMTRGLAEKFHKRQKRRRLIKKRKEMGKAKRGNKNRGKERRGEDRNGTGHD